MKKFMFAMASLILAVGLTGCTTLGIGGGPAPKLIMDSPQVELGKKVIVNLKGENFKPSQEITLLFNDVNGVVSAINGSTDPQPVADKNGAWATVWDCSRMVSKKLIKAGKYPVKAADSDYNVLAEASVTFISPK